MIKIEWLGHASFRITGAGATIYIDPWKLKKFEPKADLVLISHSHFDHLAEGEVAKLGKAGTHIICSADCAEKLHGNVKPMKPGERVTIDGIGIRATHAYDLKKDFHPRDKNWLGFLITIDGQTIYYSGDTDVTTEMDHLGKVDIALLPVGGTYTMTAAEAAQAAAKIKPGKAIPYHYGDIIGSNLDAAEFKKLCACPVEQLPIVS